MGAEFFATRATRIKELNSVQLNSQQPTRFNESALNFCRREPLWERSRRATRQFTLYASENTLAWY